MKLCGEIGMIACCIYLLNNNNQNNAEIGDVESFLSEFRKIKRQDSYHNYYFLLLATVCSRDNTIDLDADTL